MLQDVLFTSAERVLVTSLSTIVVVIPLIRMVWRLLIEELRPARKLKIQFKNAAGKNIEISNLNSGNIHLLVEQVTKTRDGTDMSTSKGRPQNKTRRAKGKRR